MPKADRSSRSEIHDEIVEFLIDDAFVRSKRLRRMTRQVSRAQEALRQTANDAAWNAYLTVEDAVNARSATQARVLVRRMLAVLAYAMLDEIRVSSVTSRNK